MDKYPLTSEFEQFKKLTAEQKLLFWKEQKEKLNRMTPEEQRKLSEEGYEFILQRVQQLNNSISSGQKDNAA